jgi:2-succinyl-5-enolpyruvyl-6-hydroxy-3-cyclohexene-1-carboxylate synthase
MTSEKISMRIDATIEGMASTPATTATFCATIVDEWVRLGVTHAVVSPGSRSTPMAIALSSNPKIALHVFHDERSASFAALGIGLQSGVPAVLLCTSGTAAAQFFAAVIEANYAHVPMLVCTADRPPELQGRWRTTND